MADEWSPVFDHDGKGCPCWGAYVRVWDEKEIFQLGRPWEGIAGSMGGESWDWSLCDEMISRVTRYQIRRPPSVQQMIDKAGGLPVKHNKQKERV